MEVTETHDSVLGNQPSNRTNNSCHHPHVVYRFSYIFCNNHSHLLRTRHHPKTSHQHIGPTATKGTVVTPITFGSNSNLEINSSPFLSQHPSPATQIKRKFIGEAAEGEEAETEAQLRKKQKRSKSLIRPNISYPQQKSPC